MGRALSLAGLVFVIVFIVLLVVAGTQALFAILLIALAAASVVGTMVVVLREHRDEEAVARYVRSPWRDEPADAGPTGGESLTGPVTVPTPEGDVTEPDNGDPAP